MRKALLALLVVCTADAAWAAGGLGAKRTDPLAAVVGMIESGEYDRAITDLEAHIRADPESADAFNWLGYANRKLGRLDAAERAYAEALRLDPDHKGAHEYAGELALLRGDLAGAEHHLMELDRICLVGCEEYRELKEAIEAHRKGSGG